MLSGVSATLPKVAVVILNWNGAQLLAQFLPSVIETNYPNFTIIVIDNGSTDDSLLWIAERYPQVQCLALGQNYGFTGGYNRALQQIQTQNFAYWVLLNSDVAVTPNWLQPLLEKNPKIAACQPKIKSHKQPDLFEYAGAAGGLIDALGYPFCQGRVFDTCQTDQGQYQQQSRVFWASGAALMVRPYLFIQIGGFETAFFAHMEEIDLCWRLQRANFEVWVCPSAEVFHLGGGTLQAYSPIKTYLNFRNSIWLLVRNAPWWQLFFILPLRFILDAMAALQFIVKQQFNMVKAVLKGMLHGYFRIFTLYKLRQRAVIKFVKNDYRFWSLNGVYKGSIVWNYFVRRKTNL
jgi:GT2 family glycosyltransferase